MTAETLLNLDFGLPTGSARGIVQTLEPIDRAAKFRRTVNETLVDLSSTAARKYRASVTCTDMAAPALDDVWPGRIVTFDSMVELSYETSTGGPSRDVVPGSSRAEGDFTFYRPRLRMMVTGYSTSKDEWPSRVAWSLDLEEV